MNFSITSFIGRQITITSVDQDGGVSGKLMAVDPTYQLLLVEAGNSTRIFPLSTVVQIRITD